MVKIRAGWSGRVVPGASVVLGAGQGFRPLFRWRSAYDILQNNEVPAIVVNARHIERFDGRKTDVMDAKGLAALAKLDCLKSSRVLDKASNELRQARRARQSVAEEIAAWKNKI